MLKKVFDTIDDILLERLAQYGVVNEELTFIKSCLSNGK